MPTLNSMFPSKFIVGDDLKGKAFALTIKHVTTEEIFDVRAQKKARKWVIYFDKAQKGVLLGKTQAKEIFAITGTADTDHWKGKKVEIYPVMVKAFGEMHNTVRFRPVTAATASGAGDPLPESVMTPVEDDDEEEMVGPVDQDNPLGARME